MAVVEKEEININKMIKVCGIWRGQWLNRTDDNDDDIE